MMLNHGLKFPDPWAAADAHGSSPFEYSLRVLNHVLKINGTKRRIEWTLESD